MKAINYPTPAEALAYTENTGRDNMLARTAPEGFDWSIFVSQQMRWAIADTMDLTRLDQYNDGFFAAIFPPHQYATTRRLLAKHGIKSTVANRARIMREAARMVMEAS